MKKLIFCLAAAFLLILSTAAFAESCDFEGDGGLEPVTNSLESGGEAVFDEGFEGRGLKLDGSYGLKLGHVEGDFSASAMVKVTSGGDNRTLFFKNMGSLENENWTGVIFNGGVPTFWVREGWSKRPTSAKNVMNTWVWLAYTEFGGTGRLYVDGELVSEGAALSDPGEIYLGVTYWSADALSGGVDNVELLDRALTQEEITEIYKTKVVPVRFERYEFPSKLIVSDLDLSVVPGGGDVEWTSDNESVLSKGGVLNRPAVDTEVTLTAAYRNVPITAPYRDITREFTFTALGGSPGTNGDTVLSYLPTEAEGNVLTDLSGNGNHGVIHGDLTGGNFDGGDWVDLPKGIFSGLDGFTLVLRLTPWNSTLNQAAFCIGNSVDEYFLLNTSAPRTNLLRAAITNSGENGEKELVSAPGISGMRYASVVITAEDTLYKMYVDGILSAEGDLGMSVADLGGAVKSYLGKSVLDAPNFRGTVNEFTVYPYVMDGDEIFEKYSTGDGGISPGYITALDVSGDRLDVSLSRDCMLAVSLYGENGGPISAEVRKVSGDSLEAGFDMGDASGAAVIAFDPASGEFKQQSFIAFDGDISAAAFDGGRVTVTNYGDAPAGAAVTLFTYEGERVTAIDLYEITLPGLSAKQIPLILAPGGRLIIIEKR